MAHRDELHFYHFLHVLLKHFLSHNYTRAFVLHKSLLLSKYFQGPIVFLFIRFRRLNSKRPVHKMHILYSLCNRFLHYGSVSLSFLCASNTLNCMYNMCCTLYRPRLYSSMSRLFTRPIYIHSEKDVEEESLNFIFFFHPLLESIIL